MADPLTAAASVVGLIRSARDISATFTHLLHRADQAPDECARIKLSVETIAVVLSSLQGFILGNSQAARSRTSLIMVDQVVVTLAACVTTFSELDAFSSELGSGESMTTLDRVYWASKEKEIRNILAQLEDHKSSLNLMLTILTCQKQEDAERKVDRLCELVEVTLQHNVTLKRRLAARHGDAFELDDASVDARTITRSPRPRASCDSSSELPRGSLLDDPPVEVQRLSRWFAFEKLLQSSRPYRFAARNASCDISMKSHTERTASWSVLSGVSLSEISHIALQAIPVFQRDIVNQHNYDFNATGIGSAVTPTGLPASEKPVAVNREVLSPWPSKSSEWRVVRDRLSRSSRSTLVNKDPTTRIGVVRDSRAGGHHDELNIRIVPGAEGYNIPGGLNIYLLSTSSIGSKI